MQQIWSRFKPYCRWLILGGTLFFLTKAFKDNWQEVAAIRITALGWATLTIALGVTLLAHIWSGWVWTWMLDELNQPVRSSQFVQVYLKTNIAKYLPGNVWHYYGRILAAKNAGVTANVATLSVLLEPLLMAAAALIVVLFSIQSIAFTTQNNFRGLIILVLVTVAIALHPRFLNLAVRFFSRLKLKSTNSNTVDVNAFQVKRYPWRPIFGELGFVGLRGIGFLLTVLALKSVDISQIPLLMGAFSLAWLLGLVIPGAPGGLGVFEVTAIALLHQFSPGLVVGAIALYRLVSILAEAAGAGLAWLDEQRLKQ